MNQMYGFEGEIKEKYPITLRYNICCQSVVMTQHGQGFICVEKKMILIMYIGLNKLLILELNVACFLFMNIHTGTSLLSLQGQIDAVSHFKLLLEDHYLPIVFTPPADGVLRTGTKSDLLSCIQDLSPVNNNASAVQHHPWWCCHCQHAAAWYC